MPSQLANEELIYTALLKLGGVARKEIFTDLFYPSIHPFDVMRIVGLLEVHGLVKIEKTNGRSLSIGNYQIIKYIATSPSDLAIKGIENGDEEKSITT